MLYTVKEVTDILKCNPSYVYKLINAGLLPALKLGRIKIRHQALTEFLEKHEGLDLTNPNDVKELI